METKYAPGLYEIVSKVKIRREPRIVEYYNEEKKYITNQVGTLNVGTQREVYEVFTDSFNSTWGRVSEPDATGNSQWICIRGLNREYARMSAPSQPVDSVEARVAKLETWARTKGYTG